MQASPLVGGEDDEQIAVSIDAAGADQLLGMLLLAYACHFVNVRYATRRLLDI